jgi:peptide deformylase
MIKGTSIVQYPAKILTTRCSEVDVDSGLKPISTQLNRFRSACVINKGVGVAAPQLGVSKRFFLYHHGGRSFIAVNPIIEHASEASECALEGCLSLPGRQYQVSRPKVVTVKYVALDGELISETLDGFAARIFQHEIDHLDGICICDK